MARRGQAVCGGRDGEPQAGQWLELGEAGPHAHGRPLGGGAQGAVEHLWGLEGLGMVGLEQVSPPTWGAMCCSLSTHGLSLHTWPVPGWSTQPVHAWSTHTSTPGVYTDSPASGRLHGPTPGLRRMVTGSALGREWKMVPMSMSP